MVSVVLYTEGEALFRSREKRGGSGMIVAKNRDATKKSRL